MGPFVINSALCVLFCSAAFLPVWVLNIKDPLSWFFYWLGLSIGMRVPIDAGSQGPVEKCSTTGQSARPLGSAQLAVNRYLVSLEFFARNLGRPRIRNRNRSAGPNRDLRFSGLNSRTCYETRMLAVNSVP